MRLNKFEGCFKNNPFPTRYEDVLLRTDDDGMLRLNYTVAADEDAKTGYVVIIFILSLSYLTCTYLFILV